MARDLSRKSKVLTTIQLYNFFSNATVNLLHEILTECLATSCDHYRCHCQLKYNQ